MRVSESLEIFSQVINFLIFIYFAIVLIKLNLLDVLGLFISVFGIFTSIIVNIISVFERRKNN